LSSVRATKKYDGKQAEIGGFAGLLRIGQFCPFVFRDKILGKSWGHKLIFLNFQHHHRFRPFPRRAHNRPAGARGANENPPAAIAVPIYPP
jgi:hypothetical protein